MLLDQSYNNVCCICNRLLGGQIEEHHLVPKMYNGTETIIIHKICHQKIHATFSESELYKYYHTHNRIIEHPQMKKFIKWVKKKPPEFYDKNHDTKERRKQRRR